MNWPNVQIWTHEIDQMNKRQEKKIEIRDVEQYDSDFPDKENIQDLIAWLNQCVEEVPPEYRSRIKYEIGTRSGYYDSSYARITVYYFRPETDEEWAARKDDVQRRILERELYDRRLYGALKARFES